MTTRYTIRNNNKPGSMAKGGNSMRVISKKYKKVFCFCWMLWFVWDALCNHLFFKSGEGNWEYFSKYHDICNNERGGGKQYHHNCKILKHAFLFILKNHWAKSLHFLIWGRDQSS